MDKEYALDFLTRMASAIAEMFGSGCETLIHDMTKPNHPIIVLFNGHVSGRQVGSEQDIFGTDPIPADECSADVLHAQNLLIGYKDYVNHLAVTPQGHTIKSSTINLVGEDYHYALGINFDYTNLSAAARTMLELTNVKENLQNAIYREEEVQLDGIFNSCLQSMGMPVASMKKRDRFHLVELLYQKKAFNFQKSVAYVSERMRVSRYTIYKYIHEIEGKTEQA